jgi:hypothetical protein
MSDKLLVFDAVSIREIAPEPYDPNIYGYRYTNGARANLLAGFPQVSSEIQRILTREPRTAASLSREIGVDLKSMQRMLDYLFTHAGDIAALELPGRPTLYIWAGVEVAEDIRSQMHSRGLSIDTRNLSSEDISALSAYITNLITLNPPVGILNTAIEKCITLLDSAKVLHSIKGGADLARRVALLEAKLHELVRRRDSDLSRWSIPTESNATLLPDDGEHTSVILGSLKVEKKRKRERYPFMTVYLLGPSYNYTGPDADKRFCADDPILTRTDFHALKKLVIELDTFAQEIESGTDIIALIERHIGGVFPGNKLVTVFRKIPSLTYSHRTERRLHKLVLEIRKRGYQVVDNSAI